MALRTERVRFGEEGVYSGYLAMPARAQGALPGVVVIQEAWGVDAHIEDVTRRIALAGYAAFAPEVYARNGASPGPLTLERLAKVKDFFHELPPTQAMDHAYRDAV